MRLAKVALLFSLASATAAAQINVGGQPAETSLPFTMTTVSTFELPWRIAFLPDGRMLVTEKVGPVWLVSATGEKISPVGNTPAVCRRCYIHPGVVDAYMAGKVVDRGSARLRESRMSAEEASVLAFLRRLSRSSPSGTARGSTPRRA